MALYSQAFKSKTNINRRHFNKQPRRSIQNPLCNRASPPFEKKRQRVQKCERDEKSSAQRCVSRTYALT